MNGFLQGLQRFGIGRLAALAGAAAGVAAVLAVLVFRVGGEPQALLYSGLDLSEASEITAALEQANVPFEARGDGSTIMVARDQVGSTRLMLASRGLPTSSSVGYELFDEGSALGQTDFVQNINRQRALEGELARNIRSLQGVTSAQVRLVLPRRQLFEESAEQPSASIIVGASRPLSGDNVRALRHFVSGAVPGLEPQRVTVLDDRGRMLAGGDGGGATAGAVGEDVRQETEARLQARLLNLVEGIVGPGNARIDVTAELNMNAVTRQREEFNPDGQVVRSTTTSEENSAETEAGADGATSASENVPGGDETADGANQAGSRSGRTNETTNYEISRTTTTEVEQPGAISRIAVAVAVNGTSRTAGDRTSYTPRTAAEIQRIDTLVKAAIGFNAERQDLVQVVPVQFDRAETPEAAEGGMLSAFDKNDLMRAIELAVLAIVGGLIVFFVARPLVKGMTTPGGSPLTAALAGPAGAAALAGPGGAAAQIGYDPTTGQSLALPAPSEIDGRIDLAKVEGQVKVSSVKRVAEFVDRHPDESVAILRNWLHES